MAAYQAQYAATRWSTTPWRTAILTYIPGQQRRKRPRASIPARVANWSLTSLQPRLVKTGGRLVKHARYYWLLLAESHLTRRLFADMWAKIGMLPPSPAG